MRHYQSFPNVYFYNADIDFRKSINGLCTIVQYQMGLNPLEEALYVFFSKNKQRIKILYWDRSGFALWYKRLEKECFRLPRPTNGVIKITAKDLGLILDGYDIFKTKPHEKLNFDPVF